MLRDNEASTPGVMLMTIRSPELCRHIPDNYENIGITDVVSWSIIGRLAFYYPNLGELQDNGKLALLLRS